MRSLLSCKYFVKFAQGHSIFAEFVHLNMLTLQRHSDTSLPQAAKKCGFCTHRFVSRQDRIDHIAEHFKNGKCMLDWSEDDDRHDSDDMNDDDDNDDRPGSDGFGNGKASFPPNNDPRGSGSGPKNDGNGGDGSAPSSSGFYQFQISQLADSDTSCSSPGVEQQDQLDAIGKQHIKRNFRAEAATSSRSEQEDDCDGDTTKSRETTHLQCSLHGRNTETAGDDSQLVARDVVAVLKSDEAGIVSLTGSDLVKLQKIPPYVPPSDGDPSRGRLRSSTPGSNGTYNAHTRVRHRLNIRAGSVTTRELLGSLKLLGAGGFSMVDEVVDRGTSLRFARKTLKNREHSALEELKKEVDVLQKLRHPHIIRFVDSVQNGDKMSILLSPVAETTLAVWLDTKQQQRPNGLSHTIVKMLGCLASSLRYLHEQRPVVKHMDIKPQNVLVKEGEEFPHVILSDFGVSSIGELTTNNKILPLTRQYCAPEVSEGVSRELASDIWSLGCVFLEMLTVAFKEDNPRWLDFRQQFGGRKGKYYWQDVPALQGLLTQSLEQAATQVEANATCIVKEMLSNEPDERPTAPQLTMVFTPAPCCLSWPNDKAAYPGPDEELQTVKTLFQEDGVDDCAHLHIVDAQQKQPGQDVARAKLWLDACSHDHEACRHDTLGLAKNKTLPTRLIDILPDGKAGDTVRLVNSADLDDRENPDYAAISHVWTDDEMKLSATGLKAMQTDLARGTLSKAIDEAIAKAQDIGFRYIWVDALCIIQDSLEDKNRECLAMADVYRNAALTIVALGKFKQHAANGNKVHGSDLGTADKNREHTQTLLAATLPLAVYTTPGFSWDTRAWSLQERLLSRRLLHLGEEQMYWECNALKASETFPRGLESFRHELSSLLWEKVHTKPTATMLDTLSQYGRDPIASNVASSAAAKNAGVVAEDLIRHEKTNFPRVFYRCTSCGDANETLDRTPFARDDKMLSHLMGMHGSTTCIVNGRDPRRACKDKGYGKTGTPHQGEQSNAPHLLKICQYIRKEGDDIGDAMEAAQEQLLLASSTLGGITGVDDKSVVGDGTNGIGDEKLHGKNRNVRRECCVCGADQEMMD